MTHLVNLIMDNWQKPFRNVTWPEFFKLTYALGQNILQAQIKFDLIIAIARGGLTISQILSDNLSLPIACFTIESYKDLHQVKLPHITHGLSSKLTGQKILLLDDICDTGKTYLRGLSYLKELGSKKSSITTAALFHKPHAKFKPDYFIGSTSAWIILPYEVKETMLQVYPLWKKQGLTPKNIQERFLTWQFPQDQVAEFLKIRL